MRFIYGLLALLLVGCQLDNISNAGAEGNSSLTLSITPTRTSLGEKVGSSYPVIWSEGDCIVANGECSFEAEIDAEDSSRATFEFGNNLSYHCTITYPYADGTTASAPKVVFAAEQSYVEGSTASGILPMCGYSEKANSGITLKHLAAILRFSVTANKANISLSKIVITSSNAQLAGEFAVNCATGTITPKEDNSNVVTYNLPTGFTLSTTKASIFHIALPAGSTGNCKVEFFEPSGEKMVASLSNRTLTAGVVREFKNLTYNQGTEGMLESFESVEDEFEIKNYVYGCVKDSNGNPISGVAVSDGFSVVTTDVNGRYYMRASSDSWHIYLSVPAGYEIDKNELNLPCIYKKYDPKQSVYNFTLTPLTNGVEQKFALFTITDLHLGTLDGNKSSSDKKQLFENTIIPHINSECDKLTAQGIACYGINLGDNITNMGGSLDDSAHRRDILTGYKMSKVPFFSVFGNHDCNYFHKDCPLETDKRNSNHNIKAQREHEDLFGPINYSFDRGNAHIVAMRNIIFPSNEYYYRITYGFTDEQVLWLRQDLANVPKDKYIIFCIHTPIFNHSYQNFDAVRTLLNQYDKVYVMSGHNHYQRNVKHNAFSAYPNSKLIEYNSAPVSGAAWRWHTAGDGTPAGYKVYINEGGEMTNNYFVSYYQGENATNHQMRLYWGDAKFGAPVNSSNPNGTKGYYSFNFHNESGKKVLLANVYNYSPDWSIKVYENGVEMGKMTKVNYVNPEFGTLTGSGTWASPWRTADDVETAHDFYVAGYMLGYLGLTSKASGAWTICFHMFKYTLSDNNAQVRVVVTNPAGDIFTEENIIGNTTFN